MYHASRWPLIAPPTPYELLAFLYSDYDVCALSSDEAIMRALADAGHGEWTNYARRVLERHWVRRYEAVTGNPF